LPPGTVDDFFARYVEDFDALRHRSFVPKVQRILRRARVYAVSI
jgi:hypothetical protein